MACTGSWIVARIEHPLFFFLTNRFKYSIIYNMTQTEKELIEHLNLIKQAIDKNTEALILIQQTIRNK